MSFTKLHNAILSGNIVVVAGAGISKDPPSNLPSWWDYNILLLEQIGKIGAETLNRKDNLFDMDKIQKMVSVTTVSEFFVNHIASHSYYPLISLLDGAKPNVHHVMLAKLAKLGVIKGIITTNFDTLIEKAFEHEKVSFVPYNTPATFSEVESNKGFPIYKIHGSADHAENAIDTVHQKLQGLSAEKKHILQRLFSENHILFIGFSGEDFLFGTDYLPVKANKENECGITWVAHPGSKFNANTEYLIKELNINVIQNTLPDFYNKLGWEMPEVYNDSNETISFRHIAKGKFRGLLEKPYIGKWACLGLCIDLLFYIGEIEKAREIAISAKKILKEQNRVDVIEGLSRISLYSALAQFALHQNELEESLNFNCMQLQIFNLEDEFIQRLGVEKKDAAYRERMLNRSTVKNNIGRILLMHNSDYIGAREQFLEVLYLAYEAMHWENIGVALSNIADIDYRMTELERKTYDFSEIRFVAIMEGARRVAIKSGIAQLLFETNCTLSIMYAMFGQKKLSTKALKNAEGVQLLCIEKAKNDIILKETIDKLKSFTDELPTWLNEQARLCDIYDLENSWEPFVKRPVLTCKEVRIAKELYDSDKIDDCANMLKESAICYIENKKIEQAEMICNCLAGFLLFGANNSALLGNVEAQQRLIANATAFYEECLELEFKMGRIDYIAGTLGSLSLLNSFNNDPEVLHKSLFQAELCLCLCNDPTDCWQVIQAIEAACRVNIKLGKKIVAKSYCELYLSTVKETPSLANRSVIKWVQQKYEECKGT